MKTGRIAKPSRSGHGATTSGSLLDEQEGRSIGTVVLLLVITALAAALLPALRPRLKGAEVAPSSPAVEGRTAPLADRPGPEAGRPSLARGQPDRRLGVPGRYRHGKGPS